MWKELERYRKMITLESGERVLLRPLKRDDGPELIALFRDATDEDLVFFQNDVRNDALVASWAEDVDLRKVFPVVSVIDGRIVGDATLHIGQGYNRHIGWIRIFLHRDHRRKGIGTELIKVIVEIARRISLQQVVAEIASNQIQAIKAFEGLGFQQEYRHIDFYLLSNNEAFDRLVYARRLSPPPGRF